MASLQWIPAVPVPAPTAEKRRALPAAMWWRLGITFLLVEAAIWTPVAVRIPALVGLVTVAIVAHRKECGALRDRVMCSLSMPYQILLGAMAVSVMAVGFAYFNGALHPAFGSHTKPWFYPGYAVWALFQELVLQGIFFLSLERIFGTRRATLLTAVLFSVAHIPNLFLMTATFLGGVLFTCIFAITRNFFVTGAIHALFGLALAVSAPAPWTHGMLVGIDYVRGRAFTGATVSTNIHHSFTATSTALGKTNHGFGEPPFGSTYRS